MIINVFLSNHSWLISNAIFKNQQHGHRNIFFSICHTNRHMLLMSAWQNWDIKALKNNPYYYVLLLVLTWDWAAVQKLWEAFQRQIFGLDLKFCRMEWKVLSLCYQSGHQLVGRPGTQWSLWFTVPSSPQRSEVYFIWSVWSERSVGTYGMQGHFIWQMTPGPEVLVDLNS